MSNNENALDPIDDFTKTFNKVRAELKNSDGLIYLDFLKTLVPNYNKVYIDIFIGYITLTFIITWLFWSAPIGVHVTVLNLIIFPTLIGFVIAYLQLFIHEGAHFNLNKDRNRSDLVCNILISWMIGTSVQKYRTVHFQHHRAIGTPEDSEHTYFFPLNLVFFFKSLFGIRALEVIVSRLQFAKLRTKTKASEHKPENNLKAVMADKSDRLVLISGLCLHSVLILSLFFGASPISALIWLAGIAVFFPFFGALRQLLEHRSETASSSINFFTQPHGAYTRIFGDGLFANWFGGAGFNRHLLHHWEPTVSYTNLAQLEKFLLQTNVENIMKARYSTYSGAFATLLKSN